MTEQQKFEAWASKQGMALHYEGDGHYKNGIVARWWQAWQARASQDRSAELLEALEAMLSQFNFGTIAGIVHDESAAIVKAREAISKARGDL